MRFPGNCLIVALVCGGLRIRVMRNRRGRLHFYWVDRNGSAWEFYTKGASAHGYLRNALRIGEIRRVPSLDQVSS